MSAPTWAGIDFGFGNDNADDVRAFCAGVLLDAMEMAELNFAFPGIDGVWMQRLGKRGRAVVWIVDAVFRTQADQAKWERDIDAQVNGPCYAMVARGRSFGAVQLRRFRDRQPAEGIAAPGGFTWAGHYQLDFVDVTP